MLIARVRSHPIYKYVLYEDLSTERKEEVDRLNTYLLKTIHRHKKSGTSCRLEAAEKLNALVKKPDDLVEVLIGHSDDLLVNASACCCAFIILFPLIWSIFLAV